MENKSSQKIRHLAFVLAVIFVFVLFMADLFRIQVVHAEDYSTQTVALRATDTTLEAARGEILDCNGTPLVTNKQINTIIFNGSYFPSTSNEGQLQRNEIISSLIKLVESYNTEWNFEIPMYFDANGQIQFKENSESDIAYLKSKNVLYLNDYATAQNCFNELKSVFKLQDYSDADALKIGSVCYSLKKAAFSVTNPYTFANDVSVELASAIKERSATLVGVEISVTTQREYLDGTIAPHIIGVIGALNEQEYATRKEEYDEAVKNETLSADEKKRLSLRAYAMDDTIGKFGIESAMESYLRGTNGVETTTTDTDGNKTTEVTTQPIQGNTVVLTLDSNLQISVQNALADFIARYKDKATIPAVGSAVVMDVNTGAVLACATYPSYNLSTYYDDYSALSADKSSPLWNRALLSTYEPGSTFKLAIALAGLEENILTENTRINCQRAYTYFSDHTFYCLHSHGSINVAEALNQSCNVFFYETGRQLGIEKMNDYCTRLGLGQKTGVEINESTGVLASISYREAHGGIWYPGDTVQAAIGQSDNLFTPIQMCNYVATIANGGTRYKAHFIKSVKSSDYSQSIVESTPVVMTETGISQESISIVKEGMARLGARLTAFNDVGVSVAAKTGTAESQSKVNGKIETGLNGFMVSFAPVEKPEIAVCVAIENLNSGSATAALVAEIYKAYFGTTSEINVNQSYNMILN